MEWGDVKVFLAVVRAGTYADAATQLRVSRPTVSRRVQALEEALGQKLFQRTGDGLVITAEGESILDLAERMEQSALALHRKIAVHDEHLEGGIRITCPEWFAGYVMPDLMVSVARKHPNIRVEILTSPRMLDLSRREADVALRNFPFDQPDIVQRKLMDVRYAVYAAQNYSVASHTGEGVNLILMNADFNHFPDVAWIQKLLPDASVMQRSNARIIQAQLCAAGLGLAVLPVVVGQKIPGLKVIDLQTPPPGRELWLGYHRDLRDVPRLKAVTRALFSASATSLNRTRTL